MAGLAPMDAVLEASRDQARWAPSGDSSQPWRFDACGVRQLLAHGHAARSH